MARDAGLPIFTTADERAIRKFAEAVRAEEPEALRAFRRDINAKLQRAYLLAGRFELTEREDLRTEADQIFAEVRGQIVAFKAALATPSLP